MPTLTRNTVVTASLVVLATTSLAAQRPQTRQGFWIAFGLGYGQTVLSGSGLSGDAEGSYTSHIRLGGTLSRHVLLAGDVTAWGKEEGGVMTTVGNTSAIVQYYPKAESGLFLKGGAGFSAILIDVSGGVEPSGSTFGLSAGVGYDIRLARNFSLTPIFDFLYGGSRNLTDAGGTVYPSVASTLWTLGLGVTFH